MENKILTKQRNCFSDICDDIFLQFLKALFKIGIYIYIYLITMFMELANYFNSRLKKSIRTREEQNSDPSQHFMLISIGVKAGFFSCQRPAQPKFMLQVQTLNTVGHPHSLEPYATSLIPSHKSMHADCFSSISNESILILVIFWKYSMDQFQSKKSRSAALHVQV